MDPKMVTCVPMCAPKEAHLRPKETLGSQMRLQSRVLGLLSQLQNVFGSTFAML